jgi:RNA polymerase sigma-70 factor (ECF subfamily)
MIGESDPERRVCLGVESAPLRAPRRPTMASLHLLRPVQPPSDDEIKLLARTDRRRALGLTVEKYRDRLFQHALYIVKSPEGAADVVQEVFIKAMREPRLFDADFRIKAWLFRVTSNLCFNIVRDRRRRGAILEAEPQRVSSEADQLDGVFHGQRQRVILAAMERLSPEHREILSLRYYSDLSYAEIAEVLEVALGTVMSRLSRAKGRLMEVLDDARVADVQ